MKLILTILLFQIISIEANCPKDSPFKKSNNCQNYCSSSEIISNKCQIDNQIIKQQYLTNIQKLGGVDFKHLSVFSNSDNILLLESSYDKLDKKSEERCFYGLSANGLFFPGKPTITINMGANVTRSISEIILIPKDQDTY